MTIEAENTEWSGPIKCASAQAKCGATCAQCPAGGCGRNEGECPCFMRFSMDGCQTAAAIDIEDIRPAPSGRIIQLNLHFKDVCPDRRIAASVILAEECPDGTEQPRGLRTLLVPAHHGDGCKDVRLSCVQFSVPDELCFCSGEAQPCRTRNFRVRIIANYVDTDYVCCFSAAAMG